MQRADISGCIPIRVDSILPEHNVEGVHLEGESEDEDKICQLVPIIHSVFHVEKSICKAEVERSLDIRESRDGFCPSANKYPVKDNDTNLEYQNVYSHLLLY